MHIFSVVIKCDLYEHERKRKMSTVPCCRKGGDVHSGVYVVFWCQLSFQSGGKCFSRHRKDAADQQRVLRRRGMCWKTKLEFFSCLFFNKNKFVDILAIIDCSLRCQRKINARIDWCFSIFPLKRPQNSIKGTTPRHPDSIKEVYSVLGIM